ncbi:uncharacterized protein BO97DRAFT_407378 [Aspergillus homomorphus CBS 101889]|uniref:Uncharacterized protein n=1 Tax=Aspergillus homomorphus (strain CBS 101889) TaxID=1450537 RepID=A0A395HQ06_ASPHC|nr:hypothetical protein BO97DRAFT_407378 [Aspergillus homomorphus CBS 101889]RAL09830.1 hypothetical protein BO97DRAFT_407378 [Aspergillus homomorphus CBS 101889]
MPSKPINSPPQQPKKAHGHALDDAPIDDYEDENAWNLQDEDDAQKDQSERLPFDAPNVAAARRMNHPQVERDHYGTSGSKNRSKTGH